MDKIARRDKIKIARRHCHGDLLDIPDNKQWITQQWLGITALATLNIKLQTTSVHLTKQQLKWLNSYVHLEPVDVQKYIGYSYI